MPGDIYLGTEIVENSSPDDIDDLNPAIERAAERSDGIEGNQYEVVANG